uniref:NADH:ubiquinone oxidoreductase complex assembly factor 2 n=1 Tax=Cynoglossus semilaevis TaxID=244447 RepID=A0A3P8VUB8_CYNSE
CTSISMSQCATTNLPNQHIGVVLAKRMMETANPSKYEYMEGSIPIEWDAWIRGRRKEPPTIEVRFPPSLPPVSLLYGLVTAPVQAVAKGHATASTYDKPDFSEEPTSTANTFQPGSWKPNSKKYVCAVKYNTI